MPKMSPDSLHALMMAMQNELDTVQIYEHMLKHVTNPQGRELLHRLIVEEHNHEQKIREKFLQAGGELSEPDLNEHEVDFPNRDQLFEIELSNCTVSELVNLAIECEQMNLDFYRVQQTRTKNEEVQNIFKWLENQEELHISNLKNEYGSYLS